MGNLWTMHGMEYYATRKRNSNNLDESQRHVE